MRLSASSLGFARERFIAPFGFKGKYIDSIWQVSALLRDAEGRHGCGVGVYSVLWSDANVFAAMGQNAGSAAMFLMSAFAARALEGRRYSAPEEALMDILPETYEYGKRVTGREDLRLSFALNALVPVDFALWQLYAREQGAASYDAMLPEKWRAAQAARQEKLGCIPLVSYGLGIDEVSRLARDGAFLLKIKIGANPDGDGDAEKMLAWDLNRVLSIHEAVKDIRTEYTLSGHPAYYLDANGRYDSRDRLMRLLDGLDAAGALERVILLEEPFDEANRIDVSDIPVRVAADESAHDTASAGELMDRGYTAMALKPIAKTLSMSLKIAELAARRKVPCFCADLTVNPWMVEWNRNVAARLGALPGLKIGVFESNGAQNYADWDRLRGYHPLCGSAWTEPAGGVFSLNEAFYRSGGGVLQDSPYYLKLAEES